MKSSHVHLKIVPMVLAFLLASAFGTAAYAHPVRHFGPFYGIPGAESWSSCTAYLCIDAPPQGPAGLDGSGGWGWNATANAPVTVLKVNKLANFTVTMLQPSTVPLCQPGVSGSVTLTYSSQDFSLSATSGSGAVASNPFDRGGVAVFSYSGDFFCHGDQSDGFAFTPLNPTVNALVTVTISVLGQQATETFPVAISR